jgi:integrase
MASISNDPGGRRLQFIGLTGKRQTVRLGRMNGKQADTARTRVETILADLRLRRAHDADTCRWIAELDPKLLRRLQRVGLVDGTGSESVTLRQLLDRFFDHLNVKPITSLGYQPTRASLLEHFGEQTGVRDITPLQADEWRRKMKAAKKAEATISKRVKLARQIFRQAVRWKMVAENPFAEVRAGSQMNRSRQRFISREDSEKVLATCPDAQWRLLFALSRFGGLRCPSEHLALKWSDVDWEAGSIRVTCSKTEHHEGRGERFVPIFPELRPHLLEVFELADAGAEHVITRYRDRNSNLRTQFERIIRRAGLSPWPRLFHNLRATRQTELAEEYPAHVGCAWIGNTERVAQNHYLQVTDDHFKRAVGEAAQKAAQCQAEQASTERKDVEATIENRPVLPSGAGECNSLPELIIAATGLEPVTRGL